MADEYYATCQLTVAPLMQLCAHMAWRIMLFQAMRGKTATAVRVYHVESDEVWQQELTQHIAGLAAEPDDGCGGEPFLRCGGVADGMWGSRLTLWW